jgi:flagellar L-ring protein FlgH
MAEPVASASLPQVKEKFNLIKLLAIFAVPALLVAQTAPGSLYDPSGALADPASDVRAFKKGDIVTILVSERATATARAGTSTARESSARAGISSVFGPIKSNRLTDLANLSGSRQLDGQGETTRENTLETTLAAIVTDVLPNGDLTIQAARQVRTNNETQTIRLDGRIRRYDLGPQNTVRSDRVAGLTVTIDGKGVVQDAVKRPNIVYRMLLGILPF